MKDRRLTTCITLCDVDSQTSVTVDRLSSSPSSGTRMLGVESTTYHSVQEHISRCVLQTKEEEVDRVFRMSDKLANVEASGGVVETQSQEPTRDAQQNATAAARQMATGTSQPQNRGEPAGDPEPPRGVPVFVMLPLDTVNTF